MLLRTLTEADTEGLKELGWKPPEEFVVKAADGKTDMHGILYKPNDFDPRKKYPVIEILYPVSEWVPRTFVSGSDKESPHVWCQAMAQLGFLTLVIDTRGSSGRANEFSDMLYRNTGRYEIPDRVTALNQLAERLPYLNLSRVGVIGYSNGGYYAIRALLEAPEAYHVGIAVAPVVDRGAHFSYMLLGPPEDNQEAYEYASLFRLAPNLKGKLLLIHGTHDRLVPLSHTMRMVEAFTRAKRPYDLMIVPGWGHWQGYEWDEFRQETYRRYFLEHLKP
jgi:dipeptidyl aminopeptidase/acylaminoacyl peptidase